MVAVKWYFIVDLICIPLSIITFGHLFRAFVYLFWGNVCSDTLPIFKLDFLSFYYWVIRGLYIFWIQVSGQICKCFFPILWVVFLLSWLCPLQQKSKKNFDEVFNFSLVAWDFSSHSCRIHSENLISHIVRTGSYSIMWFIVVIIVCTYSDFVFFFYLAFFCV